MIGAVTWTRQRAEAVARKLVANEPSYGVLVRSGSGMCAMACSTLWSRIVEQRGDLAGISGDLSLSDRLIAHWAAHGPAVLNLAQVASAIAVWDDEARELSLVRDPLGFEPLYFVRGAEGAAFATRSDVFGRLDEAYRRPDLEALVADLSFRTNLGRSFFQGVEQVRPGEIVTIAEGQVSHYRWWNPDQTPLRFTSAKAMVREYRSLLEQSVVAAMAGGGRVLATHLSAGLDSSVVTAIAANVRAAGSRHVALTGVPDPALLPVGDIRLVNEGVLAAAVAGSLRAVEHRCVRARGDPVAAMIGAPSRYHQPLPNPHNQGLFASLQDEASAVGADRLLIAQTGNYTFSMSASARSLARGPWRRLRALVSGQSRPAKWFLRDDAALPDPAGPVPADGPARRLYHLRGMNPGALLHGVREHWRLRPVDPFADRRLVEFSLRLPEDQLAALGPRGLARSIAGDLLPLAVMRERRRGYQSADWISRCQRHADSFAALIAGCRDHDELSAVLDIDALDDALRRLRAITRPTAADERLYRIEWPRAVALAAFVLACDGWTLAAETS
jgi:hypothetical protein